MTYKLKEEIGELRNQLNEIEKKVDAEEPNDWECFGICKDRIYVPKEIGLFAYSPNVIGILNTKHQLLSADSYQTYFVCSGESRSHNTGSNFYLKKVDKPVAGKAYFATDYSLDESGVEDIESYMIQLNDSHFVRFEFSEDTGYFDAMVYRSYNWRYFYEIIKE